MTHDSDTPRDVRPSRLLGRRLIRPRFQIKFSLAVFALLSLLIAVVWWSGHRFVVHMVDAGVIQKTDSVTHMNTLTHVIIRSVFFTWILAFGVALFYSHLIAGPIYRFGRVIARLKEGDFTMHVRLRRFDEFQDLAKEMDDALAALRQKARGDREQLYERLSGLETLAEDLCRQPGGEKAARLLEQVRGLKEKQPPFLY